MPKFKIIVIVLLFANPIYTFSQKQPPYQPNRSMITSVEAGTTLYNTKIAETALLIGFIDNNDKDTFEIGYVYKRILANGIGHNPNYHGIRGAGQVQLLGDFGLYCTYDILSGKRWLYTDIGSNSLAVYHKIHGEATLGIFYVPKFLLLNFYAGIEPSHYDPNKLKVGGTPHKSTSISFKLKYTIKFK